MRVPLHKDKFDFKSMAAETRADPNYGKILVLYDPRRLPVSRIIQLIEHFGGEISSLNIFQAKETDMNIAQCQVTNSDVSHMVIGLIENLSVEARGWGRGGLVKEDVP